MTIETAADWAIDNGYSEIETNTSDEFVAWQECDKCGPLFEGVPPIGVKAWRDEVRGCFVAILRYENGEQLGEQRGFGETMLAALQDL